MSEMTPSSVPASSADECPPAAQPRIGFDLFFTLVWPALAAVSLSVAVGGRDVSRLGLLSVATGTMAAYGLDRLVDRRGRDVPRLRRALIACVAVAMIVAAGLAFTASWRFQVCAVLAVIAGAYVPLKRFIPKNVLTVFAWTAATSTLPFTVRPELEATYIASVLAVAAIMAANTVICDLPDVEADRRAGVVGITPMLGVRAGVVAAATFGAVGVFAAGAVQRYGLAATACCLVVIAVLHVRAKGHGILRLVADGVVVVVPGPMALLFR